MSIVYFIIEGIVITYIEIYYVLGLANKKRFPDWVSYLVGMALNFVSAINNTKYNFMDTSVLFFGITIFIFFVFSKDCLIKRIIVFLIFVILNIIIEVCAVIVGERIGISADEYSIRLEFFRSHTTIVLCSILLIIVLIYKRKRIKNTLLPILILIMVPLLILVYMAPVIMNKAGDSELRFAVCCSSVVINAILVILFVLYTKVSNKLHVISKEKAVISQIEEYDTEYFELIQSEIKQLSFIRHDVANYIEQIRELTIRGDSQSLELAERLSCELEERLKTYPPIQMNRQCNN